MAVAFCSLCGNPACELHLEVESIVAELITRDHPEWKREDGSCPACLSYFEDLAGAGAIGVDRWVEEP
jgi:hypothetical protein